MSSSVYEYQPSFVLGFHGCEKHVAFEILNNPDKHLDFSDNEEDWLGPGIYFWEGNVRRAWEWAVGKQQRGRIHDPFVLGAVIDLKRCFDLFDRAAADELRVAYDTLITAYTNASTTIPVNGGRGPDKPARKLDCAVFKSLHQMRKNQGTVSIDSIRGAFLEGDLLYDGAGFLTHTHIQLCIRNPECIKGYFLPLGMERFTGSAAPHFTQTT